MSDVKGLSVLVYVGDVASSPSSYALVEGQTDATFDGATDTADSTAKDNAGWKTSVATTRSGTVNVSGNLRDTRTNFDKLKDAWAGGTTYACKIVFDAAGNGYKGDFYVTSLSITGATSDVAKYQMTLSPSSALVAVP